MHLIWGTDLPWTRKILAGSVLRTSPPQIRHCVIGSAGSHYCNLLHRMAILIITHWLLAFRDIQEMYSGSYEAKIRSSGKTPLLLLTLSLWLQVSPDFDSFIPSNSSSSTDPIPGVEGFRNRTLKQSLPMLLCSGAREGLRQHVLQTPCSSSKYLESSSCCYP